MDKTNVDKMKPIKLIAKNTSTLLISQILVYVISFFYFIYLARYLGVEEFGILTFSLAFTGIFGVLIDPGLNILTVRDISRDKKLVKKYLGNIITLKIILAVLTCLLIISVVNIMNYENNVIQTVYILMLSIIATAFSQTFFSIFQAYEKMEYQSLGNILNSIIIFIGVIYAINSGFEVIGFALIYLFASILIFIYSFILFKLKFFIPKIKIELKFWRLTLKEALPFGITGILVTIYYWIDTVMLSFMQGNEIVGWYNAAYRIILIALFIPSVLNSVLFPSMCRFYISSKEQLNVIYRRYFKYLAAIAIPLGFGTTILSEKIILMLFGIPYLNSAIALKILIWSTVLIFLSSSPSRLIESSNKQIIITKIAFICTLENIMINILLIPYFSYLGAAVATVITELTAFILVILVTNKMGYTISTNEKFNFLKIIFASILMSIFTIYFIYLNIVILVSLSSIIYIFSLYLLRFFDEHDFKLINNILERK